MPPGKTQTGAEQKPHSQDKKYRFCAKAKYAPRPELICGLNKGKTAAEGRITMQKSKVRTYLPPCFFIAGGVFFTADFVKDLTKFCTRLVNCIIAKKWRKFCKYCLKSSAKYILRRQKRVLIKFAEYKPHLL